MTWKNNTSLSLDHVMGIYEAPEEPGIVWVGTRGGGLNRLDTKTDSVPTLSS